MRLARLAKNMKNWYLTPEEIKIGENLAKTLRAQAVNGQPIVGCAQHLGRTKYVGSVLPVHYTSIDLKEVGLVISGKNADSFVGRRAKKLILHGWKTVQEVIDTVNAKRHENATKLTNREKADEKYAEDILKYFQCVHWNRVTTTRLRESANFSGKPYESALEHIVNGAAVHDNMEVVRVCTAAVYETYKRIEYDLANELPLEEVLQISFDLECIKRFFGELTIDCTKKPNPEVLKGVPKLKEGLCFSLNSKLDIQYEIDWKNKKSRIRMWDKKRAEYTTTFPNSDEEGKGGYKNFRLRGIEITHKSLGSDETCVTSNGTIVTEKDEEGVEWIRRYAGVQDDFKILQIAIGSLTDEIAEVALDHCDQRLPQEEMGKIISYRNSTETPVREILRALLVVKGMHQNVTKGLENKFKSLTAFVSRYSNQYKAYDIQYKEEKRKAYNAVTNLIRVLFDTAEKMYKIHFDAFERTRMLWAICFPTDEIDWETISSFPATTLQEEFAKWQLAITNEYGKGAKTNKSFDRIHLSKRMAEGLTAISDADFAKLDGVEVVLRKGCWFNSRGEYVGSTRDPEMNGTFTISADVENRTLYACAELQNMMSVPAADPSTLCVELQPYDNIGGKATRISYDKVVEAVSSSKLYIKIGLQEGLYVRDDENVYHRVGKMRNAFFGTDKKPSSDVFDNVFGKNSMLCGEVTLVVPANTETGQGGFMVLENVRALDIADIARFNSVEGQDNSLDLTKDEIVGNGGPVVMPTLNGYTNVGESAITMPTISSSTAAKVASSISSGYTIPQVITTSAIKMPTISTPTTTTTLTVPQSSVLETLKQGYKEKHEEKSQDLPPGLIDALKVQSKEAVESGVIDDFD